MGYKEDLLAELNAIDERLSWREEKGLLSDQQKALIELVNIARPFLKVLADIAGDIETIALSLNRTQ